MACAPGGVKPRFPMHCPRLDGSWPALPLPCKSLCGSGHANPSRSQLVLFLSGMRASQHRENHRGSRTRGHGAVRRLILLQGHLLSNTSEVVTAADEEVRTLVALTERRRSGSEAAVGSGWGPEADDWHGVGVTMGKKVSPTVATSYLDPDSTTVGRQNGKASESVDTMTTHLKGKGRVSETLNASPSLAKGKLLFAEADSTGSASSPLAADSAGSFKFQLAADSAGQDSSEAELASSSQRAARGRAPQGQGRMMGKRKTFIRGREEDGRREEKDAKEAEAFGIANGGGESLQGKSMADVWRRSGRKGGSSGTVGRPGQKKPQTRGLSVRVSSVLAAIRNVSPREVGRALDDGIQGLKHWEAISCVRALGTKHDWERTLALYRWMAKQGGTDVTTTTREVAEGGDAQALQEGESKLLVAVLQVLGKEGRIDEAEELFGSLEKEGRDIDVYTRTAMMGVLARTGRYDDAIAMFHHMRRDGACKPTLVTYNVLMDVYCKKGDSWQAIEDLLADMRKHDVEPDLYTFNTILSACSRDGLWEEADAVFAQIEAAGFVPDSFTYTALLGAHSRAGMHERAEGIAMQMRDAGLPLHIIAWNNIISAHGRAGRCEEAVQCVKAMEAEGVRPDKVTWGALLGAYAQCGRVEEAVEVHMRMREGGCAPNLVTWNTLVAMFGRLGERDRMMAAFKEMEANGVHPDVITWNIILDSYSSGGLCNEIANVFRDMKRAGVEPDSATYNILIDAYGRCGSSKDALGVFEGMRRAGHRPGLPAYNSLLSTYARAGEWQLAESVVDDLLAAGLKPSEITYSSLLHAYANASQPEMVIKLAEELVGKRKGGGHRESGLSFILWKTLVLVYSKCGLVREAEGALESMMVEGHEPDVQTFNAMITLQRRRTPGTQQISIDHASFYLEQMVERGVEPDLMTYNCLIASYGREGEPAKAEEMLKRARDSGLAPDTVSYNTMIVAYARAGRLKDAMRVAEAMRDAGVRADAYTYNAFIGNYVRSGLFDEAEKVIRHMRRVKCRPDAVTYNTLVDAYCKLNRFDDAWRFCDWVRKTDHDDAKALELMDRVAKLKAMQ